MKIEQNQFCNATQNVNCQYTNPLIQEIGTYRIRSIRDWGGAMLVELDSLEHPMYNHTIKIYVDKERFKAFFAEGDTVTRFRQIPEEGFRETEFQGKTVNNISNFLVNARTLHKSDLYYPWDPYD
jgi:hypothetical protein